MKPKVIIFLKVVALLIATFFVSMGVVLLALKYQVHSQIAFKMFGLSTENLFENLNWQTARTIYEIIFQIVVLFIFGLFARLVLSLELKLAIFTFLVGHLFLRYGLTINQGMTLLNSTMLIFTSVLLFYFGYKTNLVKIVNKAKNLCLRLGRGKPRPF